MVQQIGEVYESLKAIEPNDPAFANLQRRYFQTIEKYADANHGFCLFRTQACAQAAVKPLTEMTSMGWRVAHYAIMPNHVHFLAEVTANSADMHSVLSHWKGTTARACNQILQRSGAFWQRDWFDRVIRSEPELQRTIAYIRNNPVKRRLCTNWKAYKFVK